MKSHEFAKKMIETGEFLLSRPEFETGSNPHTFLHFYSNKEGFLSAVRALGAGKKDFSHDEIRFNPSGVPEDTTFRVAANRDTVCRLVRPAEYDCESLLSPEEEKELTVTAPSSDEDLPF